MHGVNGAFVVVVPDYDRFDASFVPGVVSCPPVS